MADSYIGNQQVELNHSFHGAKIIWTSLVNAWMADQGTQNNESLHYQSTWMPMSLPMSSPLLVSLEWVICTQSYWAELVGRSPCIFIVSISADDMLTCLQASRILVCYLPEKYEKLKTDFSSTLLYLLSCSKAHFTMLFVNRYTMSPPSEGWIVKTRSSDYIIYSIEAEFIQRVVAQYGIGEDKIQVSTHFSHESECNRCWPDICQGHWESFETRLPKDVHILSCHSLLRSSFNIGPAKMPSLS